MPSAAAISGILTPHMVPLDSRGEINEEELTRGIYDAERGGRIDEALTLQRTLIEIFDPLIEEADFSRGVSVRR